MEATKTQPKQRIRLTPTLKRYANTTSEVFRTLHSAQDLASFESEYDIAKNYVEAARKNAVEFFQSLTEKNIGKYLPLLCALEEQTNEISDEIYSLEFGKSRKKQIQNEHFRYVNPDNIENIIDGMVKAAFNYAGIATLSERPELFEEACKQLAEGESRTLAFISDLGKEYSSYQFRIAQFRQTIKEANKKIKLAERNYKKGGEQ